MESACAQNTLLRISVARPQRSESALHACIAVARTVGGALVALNVTLGRRTSLVPGMSDRWIARLAAGERIEDVARWNALTHQYAGTRFRR